jgi:hypothetical protein
MAPDMKKGMIEVKRKEQGTMRRVSARYSQKRATLICIEP